jgi:hypothetical protein
MSLQLSRPISRRHHGVSSNAAISPVRITQVQSYRLLVRVASFLFVALLIEGICRKWLFPGHHEYFYFLRDPILLGFYLLAVGQGAIQLKGWFALWFGAAVFTSLTSLAVYVLNDLSPQLWLLGVRNYFLYMPLAFIVARTFERDDIERLARLVALLAVPIAFICLKQSFSPRGDWLNVGAGGALPPIFADGLLRTTGVLASDAQHVMYIAFTLSLLVAAFVGGRMSRQQRYILIAGAVSTFAMMMVSGSRAIWFQGVGVSLVTAYSFFLSRARISQRLRAIMVPLTAVLAVTVLFSTLLPGAYRAYERRNETAGTFSSGSIQRIAGMILPPSMFEASIGGAGIGTATTGAAAFSTGKRELTAEGDWHRNFIELGLFGGWIFVALRIMFTLWLVSISVRAARSGDPMALLLATFAALAIFQSQITMHTAYAHLTWFAVGLTMAATRATLAPVGARAVVTGTMPPRRGMIGWPAPPPVPEASQRGAQGAPSKHSLARH